MSKEGRPAVVEVTWVDTTSWHTWLEEQDYRGLKPTVCVSVGYLLKNDKRVVRMAMSHGSEDTYGMIKVIPQGCIRKVRTLRKGR